MRNMGMRLYWTVMVAFTLAITWVILRYFDFQPSHGFLEEKFLEWQQPLWRICFYNHVAAGALCLLSALCSFSRQIRWRSPATHRRLGQLYGLVTCLVLVPTGLYLALFAKGGPWGKWGFALNGILLLAFTVVGIHKAIQKQIAAHRRWILRSYGLAATAISFRALHVALALFLSEHSAYVSAIWGSLLLNIAVVEWHLRRPPRTHHKGERDAFLSVRQCLGRVFVRLPRPSGSGDAAKPQ